MATTIDGIEPVLNYDTDYSSKNYRSFASEVHTQPLTLVREKISFPSKTDLGKRQLAKFEKALDILEEVMNSEEFKTRVISYVRSNGKREYQKNYLWKDSTRTFTNEEIYELIMTGDEKMRPNTIGEMNFNSRVKICRWYENVGKWCRGVVGSTTPASSANITLNWKFYKKYETHQMVSNMVHEWLHLLGFLHGKVDMREEVPYVVGGIAGQVAKEFLEREQQ